MYKLRLSQKIRELRMVNDSIIYQAIANLFEITADCVISIIKTQSTLEPFETSASFRKF